MSSSTTTAKSLIAITGAPERHWVGDGFPVHGMFGYSQGAPARSPFLLLDYAAPLAFAPNTGPRRGVGAHPHRGFETVTLVYEGEVEHRDSAGGGGVIGAGDVQWMTAGSGVLHDEFHSASFSARGGNFHVVQLWVNLPAKDKMHPPRYQALVDAAIPAVALPGGAGTVRLIAGTYAGQAGPAQTFTPMHLWDVQLQAGASVELPQPEGWTTLLLVQSGAVTLGGTPACAQAGELMTLSHAGTGVQLQAQSASRLLLMAGAPIDEPIAAYGPFVMNTQDEIRAAIADYQSGQFGQLA